MNILMDSLNCNPRLGSNAAIGSGFVREAARRNRVLLMTHQDLFQPPEEGPAIPPWDTVRLFPVRPGLFRKFGRQTDYLARCYFRARAVLRKHPVDVVHTVEPNQYLLPRPLCFLDRPFVLGPIHGGAAYPPPLFLEDLKQRYPARAFSAPARPWPGRLADRINHEIAYGRISRAFTRAAFRRARRIVVGTQNCMQHIPREEWDKCVAIRSSGVDLGLFCPRPRPENRFPVVLFAGRVTEVKALDLLLKAFSGAVRRRDMVLKIAGSAGGDARDEAYFRYCRGLCREYGLDGRVEFLGHVRREDLAGQYQACDVFCLPSLWETFGLVFLEAMACGVPCIATDAGGPSEIIEDGFGIKVRPGRLDQFIEDLAGSLVLLAADAERRKAMGRRAREHAEARYAWAVLGGQMQKVYESV